MKAKTIATIGLKVIVLTLIMFLCYAGASAVSGTFRLSPTATPPPGETQDMLWTLLLIFLLQTAVLAYVILRSRWSGWKLVGAVFLAFYGLSTVIAQIESIIFLQRQLPEGMILWLFVLGAVAAALFSPLAVLILGKARRCPTSPGAHTRPAMPPWEWAWKLVAIAIAYEILYFSFGYFVAWQNPTVRAYYGGSDPGRFFAQMAWIGATTPWMFPLQAFRAMLWTAFALPAIRTHKGRPWEVSLAAAMLFAVWSSQLLLPNPYMPETVARIHLVETLASNFIFGGWVGWLLSQRHSSAEWARQFALWPGKERV
jgi:hypothetical protein